MGEETMTVCDCCGEGIDLAEANYDAFGYGVLCNECYAEAMFGAEDSGDEEE